MRDHSVIRVMAKKDIYCRVQIELRAVPLLGIERMTRCFGSRDLRH
jgi:hypothetical protein